MCVCTNEPMRGVQLYISPFFTACYNIRQRGNKIFEVFIGDWNELTSIQQS